MGSPSRIAAFILISTCVVVQGRQRIVFEDAHTIVYDETPPDFALQLYYDVGYLIKSNFGGISNKWIVCVGKVMQSMNKLWTSINHDNKTKIDFLQIMDAMNTARLKILTTTKGKDYKYNHFSKEGYGNGKNWVTGRYHAKPMVREAKAFWRSILRRISIDMPPNVAEKVGNRIADIYADVGVPIRNFNTFWGARYKRKGSIAKIGMLSFPDGQRYGDYLRYVQVDVYAWMDNGRGMLWQKGRSGIDIKVKQQRYKLNPSMEFNVTPGEVANMMIYIKNIMNKQ